MRVKRHSNVGFRVDSLGQSARECRSAIPLRSIASRLRAPLGGKKIVWRKQVSNPEGEKMKIDIDHLTEAELIELNNKVVARLRFLAQMRAHAQMLQFNIGDRVSFQPPGRPLITGMLTRYNRKSVTVITDSGQQWNVAPGLLRKAESEINSCGEEVNVVQLHKK